jgi:DedD protein
LERKLQQRLVGISVLAAFAILIAPVLLDGEGRIPEKITNIPVEPERPDLSHIQRTIVAADVTESAQTVDEEVVIAVEPTVESDRVDSESVSDDVSVPDDSVIVPGSGSGSGSDAIVTASEDEVHSPGEEPAPVASSTGTESNIQLWSVQVASFKDSSKAVALRDRLRNEGFKTYSREKLLSDDTLFTQVFVGPVESKDEANDLKADVKAKVQLQGLVVHYRDR